MEREYDVVVFGATGNAGQPMAQLLSADKNVSFAIAGRSEKRLNAVRAKLDGKCGMIIADCTDHKSMLKMCQAARVLITSTGPYTIYGEAAVKACIEAKTHYVDITGEVSWVGEMRSKYGDAAQAAGVCISSMCGYDCIPPELSICLANDELGRDHKLTSVECLFSSKGEGGLPRGTALTLLPMFTIFAFPTTLFKSCAYVPSGSKWVFWRTFFMWMLPTWSSQIQGFTAPNFMGLVNIPVVVSSARAFGFGGMNYYDRMPLPSHWYTLWGLLFVLPLYAILGFVLPLFMILNSIPAIQNAIKRKLEARAYHGSSESSVIVRTKATGTAVDGKLKIVSLRMVIPGDPGIYATAFLAAQTALTMIDQLNSRHGKLPAGFCTPVVALGTKALKTRFVNNGCKITTKVL